MVWYMQSIEIPHTGVSQSKVLPTNLKWVKDAQMKYDEFWKGLSGLSSLNVLRVTLITFIATDDIPGIIGEDRAREFPIQEMRNAWLRPINRLKDQRLRKFELVLGRTWIEVMWDRKRTYLSPYNYRELLPRYTIPSLVPVENELFTLFSINHGTLLPFPVSQLSSDINHYCSRYY